jgi:hypothetical protein
MSFILHPDPVLLRAGKTVLCGRDGGAFYAAKTGIDLGIRNAYFGIFFSKKVKLK